jgi:pimeloyl-ACP methyl ester carboxylesterase
LDHLLAGHYTDPDNARLAKHLRKHRARLLVFLDDDTVAPTNARAGQEIRPAGRDLGHEDVGVPNGQPIFYFHGVPSAHVEWHMWSNEALLQGLGVRLIEIDRPGGRSSTFQPIRRVSEQDHNA